MTPGHLLEVNQFVFGGRLDFGRPLRVLNAGGGTGNESLMLAGQMAALGLRGEVVEIDISAASQAISKRRAKRRGLANIRHVHGSLLDVATLAPGPFDYINCSGVLHHLASPDDGLAALGGVLAPGGGMGIMVYGEIGRIGLYHLQRALRLLDDGRPLADKLALTRRLLCELPPHAWIKRNPVLGTDHARMSDAEIVDRYLHTQDRAYTVPQIFQWADRAGLRVSGFAFPARYDPRSYLDDPDVARLAETIPPRQRAEVAELLCGDMATHTFYLVPDDGEVLASCDPASEEAIPVLRGADPVALAAKLTPGQGFRHSHGGRELDFPLSELSAPLIARMNGRTTLADIHRALKADHPALSWPDFQNEFGYLYDVMHHYMYQLFLSRTPMPPGVTI